MALDNIPVWSIPPDWSGGITETLEWFTAVMASPKGTEQRAGLRVTPRRSFEMTFKPVGPVRTLFDLSVLRIGAQEIYAPLWHEVGKLGGIAISGSPVLTIDTTYTEFPFVDAVFIQGDTPYRYEIAEVFSTTDTSITLSGPLANTWPPGTRVFPMQRFTIEVQPSATKRAAFAFEVKLKFSSVDTASFDPGESLSHCCILDQSDEREELNYSYEEMTASLDNQTGKLIRTSTNDNDLNATSQDHMWWAKGRQQNMELRGLLYLLQGRKVPIWIPTYYTDLELVEPITDSLVVKRCGYTDMGGPATNREFVYIDLKDGCAAARKVISSTLVGDGATERLVLNRTIDAVIRPQDVRRISFLTLNRLDQDLISIVHHTDSHGLSTAKAVFRSVGAEEMRGFNCFDGGFSLLYPNILRFGWDSYPADYFPNTENTYLVMDRGNLDSDASLLMRHQGNGRVEFGLMGNDIATHEQDDYHVKIVSGSYPSEVFTTVQQIRAHAALDGIAALSTEFYGNVRVFGASGKPALLIGTINGQEYPDGLGSGLEIKWNNVTTGAEIQANTWNAFYRNIDLSANTFRFHAGPVFLNYDSFVITTQGGAVLGRPVQLADRAFISNGGPGGIAEMHGYTPGAVLTAVSPASGAGAPSTWTVLHTMVSAVIGIAAAGTGGTTTPSTSLTVKADPQDTTVTVFNGSLFANGDPIVILQDLEGYFGTYVDGAPVGNVITLLSPLPATASVGNVVYKPALATGTTGTADGRLLAGVRIVGGGVNSVLFIYENGVYSVNPTNLANEPVTISGVTGAALEITMGARDVERLDPGAFTMPPITPVHTTSSDGGLGATLDINYQNAIGSMNLKEVWENGVRLMPPASNRYIHVGDSLTVGIGGTPGSGPGYTLPYNYYLRYPVFNSQHGVGKNIAVTARTLQRMYDTRATTIAPLFNNLANLNGSKNIVCLQGGLYDLIGGTSAADVWTLTQSFITYLKNGGWYVIVTSLPSCRGFDTQRSSLNTLLVAGWSGAGADRLVDLAADADLGPNGFYTDTTYFAADGINLTDAGHIRVASYFQAEIDDLVASFTPMSIPTITGSRGGNAALADLLTKLADRGILVNSTS